MFSLVGISLLGFVAICIFSFVNGSPTKTFGVSSIIAIAALLFGLVTGFIFGIPKAISSETNDIIYADNSNLEQISDWLTKVITGIALFQLASVPGYLQQFSEYIQPALGNSSNGGIFGTFILVSYSLDGFLIGYLGTRRCAAVDFSKAYLEQKNILKQVLQEIRKTSDISVIEKALKEANILGSDKVEQAPNNLTKQMGKLLKVYLFEEIEGVLKEMQNEETLDILKEVKGSK
jgi:hypothetical protein